MVRRDRHRQRARLRSGVGQVSRAEDRAELPQRRALDPAPQLAVELLLQPHRPLRVGGRSDGQGPLLRRCHAALSGAELRLPGGRRGWASSLYADLIGHWEKRHRNALENTNPARLDHAALLALAEKYGQPLLLQAVQRGEGLDDNGNGTGGVEDLDDYSRCQITRKEDIRDLFVPRYYFGCEADDPLNAWAFNGKANPMGARLNALFSSDIGHFDVPDMTEVVPEAYELVEDGLLDGDDFRDFMFANAVRFWGEVNPDFFKGTVVEKQAAEVLGRKAC